MFETSVVHERTAAGTRRASVLSVSLAVHAAVIVGAVGVGIASVDFPKHSPDQFAQFQTVMPVAPPPLGRPDGGQRPAAREPQPKPATTTPPPAQDVAPRSTPDTIPEPDATPSSSDVSGPAGDGPAGPGSDAPWGSPDGDPNSVGTDLNALPIPGPPQPPVEEKIHRVGGEVRAPRVIHRVEPKFPPILIRTGVSGTVVVHCVIDKNGRVRDAKVSYSSQPMLNAAVLDAVQQWRFEPAALHGNAVDAYFDLTVNFTIRR